MPQALSQGHGDVNHVFRLSLLPPASAVLSLVFRTGGGRVGRGLPSVGGLWVRHHPTTRGGGNKTRQLGASHSHYKGGGYETWGLGSVTITPRGGGENETWRLSASDSHYKQAEL